MTIIFNQDGSIRYLELGEYVQKGNHNVDLIQVGIYGQDITSDTVTAQFQLPDESTNQIIITTTGTVDYGDTTINVRKFYLTNAQTVFAGVLKMSIQVVNAQGKTLYTYLTRLTINESTALADSTTITQEEYNEIVTALAGKQGIYVSSNVRAYATRTLANADLTNLAENQVVFILENSLLHSYMVQSGAFVPYEIYGSGSGGTGDYDYLAHKPQINGQTLEGNKTAAQLGIIIPTQVSQLTNDSNYAPIDTQALTHYYTETEVDTLLNAKVDVNNVKVLNDIRPSSPNYIGNAQSVWDRIESVRAIATGKEKAYILSYNETEPTESYFYSFFTYYKLDGTRITTYAEFQAYVSGKTFANASFNTANSYLTITDDKYLIFRSVDAGAGPVAGVIIAPVNLFKAQLHVGDTIFIVENKLSDNTTTCPDRWYGGVFGFYAYDGKVDMSGYQTLLSALNKLNIDYIDETNASTKMLLPKLPAIMGDGIYSLFAVKEDGVVSYQWQIPTYDGGNE